MATVTDLSGNTPQADRDQSLGGNYNLQAVTFLGAQHTLTLGSSAVASDPVSRECNAIRIAPEGDCHYEVGVGAVATKDGSPFLASGAVEIIPVSRLNTVVSVIQDGAQTDKVIVTENR